MHDSVTHDFDRVSDFNDNGLTSLQGQQDEQPKGVNRAENAIDNDVVDIMTLYPQWSTDTNDRCDNNQVASDRNRKEIQDELYKDTSVKTEKNKPYIDNIDAYNRDRALITKSLSDRLGLGQNSLLGAQQVRVAVKHTDQMIEIPEHIRQISLGEEMKSTSDEEIGRNRNFIPQVDGTVDSRDSLDQTPDSIDLTKSPVKHTNTQRHTEKIDEDTSDDTDEMIDFDNDKVRKTYRLTQNTDNATINADNTSDAATDGEKSDDAAMSDNDTDNTTTGNDNTDNATTGDGNTHNTTTGNTSTVDIPLPLCYGSKTKDPSKIKTSKKAYTYHGRTFNR